MPVHSPTPVSTDESDRFLASPLLAGADRSLRLAVFRQLAETTVPAGSPLMVQGRPNDRLWFIREGSASIERTRPDGRVDRLITLDAPAIFGTTTFFRPAPASATIRATSDLAGWTLDREAHEALRRDNPRAAEALALGVVRVLSERFDLLDVRLAGLVDEHGDDHPKVNEWANFRSRLFEEPAL